MFRLPASGLECARHDRAGREAARPPVSRQPRAVAARGAGGVDLLPHRPGRPAAARGPRPPRRQPPQHRPRPRGHPGDGDPAGPVPRQVDPVRAARCSAPSSAGRGRYRSTAASTPASTPRATRETFAAVERALAAGDVICLFPEGVSHVSGRLEPLRTGAARMALAAAAAGRHVSIVPVRAEFRPPADVPVEDDRDVRPAVRRRRSRGRLPSGCAQCHPRPDRPHRRQAAAGDDRGGPAGRPTARRPRRPPLRRRQGRLAGPGRAGPAPAADRAGHRPPARGTPRPATTRYWPTVLAYDEQLRILGLREQDLDRRMPAGQGDAVRRARGRAGPS